MNYQHIEKLKKKMVENLLISPPAYISQKRNKSCDFCGCLASEAAYGMNSFKCVRPLTNRCLYKQCELIKMKRHHSRSHFTNISLKTGNVTQLSSAEDESKEGLSAMEDDMLRSKSGTVLVTGGAGFLGQHIISLLQTKADHVTDIKVLDIKEYKNNLGHDEYKPVTSVIGSVTDFDVTKRAFAGVDCVYHVAGQISYGTFPDIKSMHKVNVLGTSNVITACIEASVKRLIFCSTVDVVIGYQDIENGCEATTKTPEQFLFPGYPDTKYRAECLVLKANGTLCKSGDELRTMSLRANVMYGEGDPYYVTNGLKTAKQSGNVLYQVGDGSAKFQPAYVGNTAWAFICADCELQKNELIGGQYYFIPDETPVQNTFHFMRPFLEVRGYRLSRIKLPFQPIYCILVTMEMVARVLSSFFLLSLPAESYSLKYINMNIYFNNFKARKELGYVPLFSPIMARNRSLEYYKNIVL